MAEYHDDTDRQKQEQDEMEQWLDQYDRETIKNLDEHMQRMWESFNKTFNANQPKEASNGTDSQKT